MKFFIISLIIAAQLVLLTVLGCNAGGKYKTVKSVICNGVDFPNVKRAEINQHGTFIEMESGNTASFSNGVDCAYFEEKIPAID